MKLKDLLATLSSSSLPEHPALEAEVRGLATNSHACQPGDLFIGMPGTRVDGGEFWSSAIALERLLRWFLHRRHRNWLPRRNWQILV